ncbi:uncharacterized protein K02A2.6-like [Corticium candelabrum]|uniref:uncharacterized protein K02A2.6-like n=1 Tax=Corticium candelabrum TaxID=121492 RepID=UPI002E26B5BA|nr:uncharacterized protein K02A2.6-like [Corticium candelabrum]
MATNRDSERRPIETLDITGPAHIVAERWRKWKRSFQYYIEGQGITDHSRQRSLLLHYAGTAVQDIHESLTEAAVTDDNTAFSRTVDALDTYFQCAPNTPYERHTFRQMRQNDDESVDQFASRLRMQAKHCNFQDEDDQLRDQLIEHIRDARLRRKLLETVDIQLRDVLKTARVWESVDQQARGMQHALTPAAVTNASGKKPDDIAAVRYRRQLSKGQAKTHSDAPACTHCGRSGHYARSEACPARGKTCNKCHKRNHFASQCRSQGVSASSSGSPQRRGTNHASDRRQKHRPPARRSDRAHQVTASSQPDSGEDEDESFAFTIGDYDGQMSKQLSTSTPTTMISLNGVTTQALIDSGASCNIMGDDLFHKLCSQGLNVTLRVTSKTLYAYASRQPLDVVGQFTANATIHGRTTPTEFVVIRSKGQLLLGRKSAQQFGVLRLKPERPHTAHMVNTSGDQFRVDIEQRYPQLFHGVGKLDGYQAHIHIDPQVRPVAQKPRRIPFALRKPVSDRLEELLTKDIIEKVDGPTSWVSPVVVAPKASGEIRLCVDMRRANEAIIRERYPIPTVDEILQALNGSTVFSKLDLRWGFHQVELDEASRDITTFAVNDGLYRYKRMMFGITSAPEKYQHIVSQLLTDCPGALNIADDLIVYGPDQGTHDANLFRVLDRLRECGLTLNLQKCWFRRTKVEFYGLQLSGQGVEPSKDKIQAIIDAPRPSTAAELRSFLGIVGFSARFLPDLSTTAEPLRRITHRNNSFTWTDEQERAFTKLKKQLAKATALAYFDHTARTQVIADASPVGLGAVLVQQQPNGSSRAICYASRTLTSVERRYSQTEKEALGLVWACERFHQYLYGTTFDLVTDHKPLQVIYSQSSKPSARIERWVLRLQAYTFKVKYVTGPNNIADALSRLPTTRIDDAVDTGDTEESVHIVTQCTAPCAIAIKDIETASASDDELQTVRRCISTNDWTHLPHKFMPVRHELTAIGQVVLRGTRIVPPSCYRDRILELAHEGHQGIVKTKERLRTKVWWPGIDRQAEMTCKTCISCQAVSQPFPPAPVKSTALPQGPWEDLATDLLGPLPTGETLLVTVDYYSRYFEVDILRSTTAQSVINRLNVHFARYGIPRSIRTDNGPQFIASEFTAFLNELGIQHRRNTPLWPRANGEVERQNRTLLKAIKVANLEQKPWRVELQRFLLAYRSTPHSTTGVSPAELLFRRPMRSKLPAITDTVSDDVSVRDRDSARKQTTKDYADQSSRALDHPVTEGDRVLVRNTTPANKLSPTFLPDPYTVVSRHGDQLVLESPGKVKVKRNVQLTKPVCERKERDEDVEISAGSSESANTDSNTQADTGDQAAATTPTQDMSEPETQQSERPKRTIVPPARFKSFVTSFR